MEPGRWIRGLLLSIILPALLACSTAPKRPDRVIERRNRAAEYAQIGDRYYRSGQYEHALSFFQITLELSGSVDHRAGVAAAYQSIGRTQMALGRLDAARESLETTREIAREIAIPELEAQAVGGLGQLLLREGHPEEAVELISQALEGVPPEKSSAGALLLHDRGEAYKALGRYDLARVDLEQALELHERFQDRAGQGADCFSLASLHSIQGRYDQALELARQALAWDKQIENGPGIATDLEALGKISERAGRPEDAAGYYNRAALAWQGLQRVEETQRVLGHLERLAVEFSILPDGIGK